MLFLQGVNLYFDIWKCALILAISIVYSPMLVYDYTIMDDIPLWHSGAGLGLYLSQARVYDVLIFSFIKATFTWSIGYLKVIIFLSNIIFNLILYDIFISINRNKKIALFSILIGAFSLPMMVFNGWITLGVHIVGNIAALFLWKSILRPWRSIIFAIVPVFLSFILCQIYQPSLFFVFVPFLYFVLYSKHEATVIFRNLQKIVLAVIPAVFIYIAINFMVAKIFATNLSGRLAQSFTVQELFKKFINADLKNAAAFVASVDPWVIQYLYYFLLFVCIVNFLKIIKNNKGYKNKIFISLSYLSCSAVIIPTILQGFGDFRTKISIAYIFSISLVYFLASSIQYFSIYSSSMMKRVGFLGTTLAFVLLITISFNGFCSYIYPYVLEQSYLMEGLKESDGKSLLVKRTNTYPHDEAFFFTKPAYGHEASVKLTSQYVQYNGGSDLMIKYLIERSFPGRGSFTSIVSDCPVETPEKNESVNLNTYVLDLCRYEQGISTYVQKSPSSFQSIFSNPFLERKDIQIFGRAIVP
jgi:hypothetical protein